jgi:integration host factor subunit beta
MTKADLVDQVTALGDLTRRDGEVIVDTLFESVIGALKANDKVEVRGFGSFRTRQRNPRTGRNPKTGASVAVPCQARSLSSSPARSCATSSIPAKSAPPARPNLPRK